MEEVKDPNAAINDGIKGLKIDDPATIIKKLLMPDNQSLEAKAMLYAYEKHKGQLRKDNETPYICHPATVRFLTQIFGVNDTDALAAAWLHDVVEDTNSSIADIKEKFNENIANYVGFLTKRTNTLSYLQGLLYAAPRDVNIIKVADIVHNMIDSKNIKYDSTDEQTMLLMSWMSYCDPVIDKYLGDYPTIGLAIPLFMEELPADTKPLFNAWIDKKFRREDDRQVEETRALAEKLKDAQKQGMSPGQLPRYLQTISAKQ